MRNVVRRIWVVAVAIVLAMAPATALADSARQLITSTYLQLAQTMAQVTFLSAMAPGDKDSNFSAEEQAFTQALATASASFADAGSMTSDTTIKGYAGDFAGISREMQADLAKMATAVAAQNGAELQTDLDDFQQLATRYTTAGQNYNNYLNSHSGLGLGTLHGAVLVVSAELAVGLLIFWLRVDVPDGDLAAERRKGLRRALVVSSLFPLVASTVSFVWYRRALDKGGADFAFWVLVVGGFFALIRRVLAYRRIALVPVARPLPVPVRAGNDAGEPVWASPDGAGTPIAPLLREDVRYFPKPRGRAVLAAATLLPGSIELARRGSGVPLASIPIRAITDLQWESGGVLSITEGPTIHRIMFGSITWGMFGLLGILLSGGPRIAKRWLDQLTQLRVLAGLPAAG